MMKIIEEREKEIDRGSNEEEREIKDGGVDEKDMRLKERKRLQRL